MKRDRRFHRRALGTSAATKRSVGIRSPGLGQLVHLAVQHGNQGQEILRARLVGPGPESRRYLVCQPEASISATNSSVYCSQRAIASEV